MNGRTRVGNGVLLYYEEHGAGEPILCIHGAGSSASMWENAIPKLARLGRVIAYDRRGCTRSERPKPYEHTSVAEQADDAAGLLDALGARPALVIGRSYGGAVAVELALRHPSRVRALALLEGDALGLSPAGLEWTRRLRGRLQEVASRDGVESVYETLIEEALGAGAWESFPAEVQQILSQNGAAVLAELAYVEHPMPDAAMFGTIDVPTLLVVASESPPEQRDMSYAMSRALPNSRTVEVGGGHLIDPAGPEVLAFIEETLDSR